MASMSEMREAVKTAAQEIRDSDPTYVSDAIHEYADSLVPIYTSDVIKEWELIDIYDGDDYCGEYSIVSQMQWALYEWYVRELTIELEDSGETGHDVECGCSNPYCQV